MNMASSGLTGELKCSICLGIYTNPVMLTCGHNFCESCIVNALDRQRRSRIYTCPECREQFISRPVLQKNRTLGNIAEHYLSSCQSSDNESFCTYCVAPQIPAVKMCVHCEVYLCHLHVDKHSQAPNHILIDPSSSLEKPKCTDHNGVIKYFCNQDSSFLCAWCTLNFKHKGHDLELLSDAGDKKRLRLCEFVKNLTEKTEEYENVRRKVEQYKKGMLEKSGVLKNKVDDLFGGIREALNDFENRVLAEINKQEIDVSKSCSQMLQRLDTEIKSLYERKIQIHQACKNVDHLTLLKQDDLDAEVKPIRISVATFNEEMISVTIMNAMCKFMEVIPSVKEECGFGIEDSTDLVFNVNTADPIIALSNDLKEASETNYRQKARPHLPERFYSGQVLSTKKILSGKHYWEIKASDDGDWSIGVTYNNVKKSGFYSKLGKNDKSWCISWSDLYDALYVEHDNEREYLSHFSHEIGIYLDYEDGLLSFYELSDTIEHLHTFHHNFTQPLHFGIYADQGTAVRICR